MKKFRFKLQAVLTERKRLEDLKLREWTLAQRILLSMIADREKLEKRLGDAIREATVLAALPDNTSGEFRAMDAFIGGLKLRIRWKNMEIERGSKFTERKRLEYVAASQKRKALDKLRERRLEEFKEQALKRELKELDDVYIMRGIVREQIRAGIQESEEGDPK